MSIQFNKVTHIYKSVSITTDAIYNIDLNINETNEFICICGHTGSGKSTLVQHMNALLFPTSGTIDIFGNTIPSKKKSFKYNFLRQKVGLVFQFPEYQLFEQTILKDVMFGPKNFKVTSFNALERAKEALNQVGIKEELFERSPFRISGGQTRRVAVAGILAMDPSILVLDEPTRGLDPVGQEEIMDLFSKIHETTKKTIVLITHDMDVVSKYAKRVIVLKKGQIVFDGSKNELFVHPNFHDFSLELPTTIKIINYLKSKLNIEVDLSYNTEELCANLKKVLR